MIISDNLLMVGSLPDELFSLVNLEELSLKSCRFSGSISPNIKNLKKLTKLNLSLNILLNDEILSNLVGLTNLIELDLSRKLTDSDRTYIARGIGILLGDESIFTPDGTLVPTAFERRDKLRERLIQRKIMYDDGAINQLVLQQVIHDGANKALSTITREE